MRSLQKAEYRLVKIVVEISDVPAGYKSWLP